MPDVHGEQLDLQFGSTDQTAGRPASAAIASSEVGSQRVTAEILNFPQRSQAVQPPHGELLQRILQKVSMF